MAKKATKTIEDTFSELEEIIGKLENGESSLEESFQLYESGMKLVKGCNEAIDKVEKQIVVLNQEALEHE